MIRVKIPIIYVYIYSKIKEKNKGNIVSTKYLKEVIKRIMICGDGYGGNRKGIPKCYLYDIINDLRELTLIQRINHSQYRILTNPCEKKLRDFPY